MLDAVVVGSGPNGLAAAVTLAEAGLAVTVLEAAAEPGGGTRTAELTVPGVLHDVCAAVHPLGAVSPFLAARPLADHGLTWRHPEVDMAHPLDGGRAGVVVRSLDDTVAGLGADGPAWRRLFEPLVARIDDVLDEALAPVLHLPHHPLTLVNFGVRALAPATWLARLFRTEEARGAFAGAAAHAITSLDRPLSAAAGLMLLLAGHRGGWPVAAGGSQAITTALLSLLAEYGGKVETGVRVSRPGDLPPARVTLFDTAPGAVAEILGDRLPYRVARAYRRWRPGSAVFKLDLAVEGGIPWVAEPCRRAGTVHVGGTFEEVAAAEHDVDRGRMPARPFVLVAQQYLCDPSRSAGDTHPVWAYAHVPRGYDGDATDAILDQVERFAPGFRDRIVGRHVMGPADYAAYNPNYVGGDVATGATDFRHMLARPRLAPDPYATGVPGAWLCSAATPPGPGVHGMCGYQAATRALAWLGPAR
jgi:phytoene dehydrogenase-like protein